MADPEASPGRERKKGFERNVVRFDDRWIRNLKPPRVGQQDVYWDDVQRGLALLVSSGGTKSFRSQYKLNDRWRMRTLGRFGEVVADQSEPDANVRWAREQVRLDRIKAKEGVDPKKQEPKEEKPTFKAVLDQFIELYAKPNQRTWYETERVLTKNCAVWFDKPIADITEKDAYRLLDGFITAGKGGKANMTLSWLRALWRWAARRKLVTVPPIMDLIARKDLAYERQVRDRVYDADELKAIWNAADQIDPIEGGYIKLLLLLAPRKNELAKMEWSELDDPANPTLWTTPHERTKTRKSVKTERIYKTPLPPFAQSILKKLPQRDPNLVFPGRVHGKPIWPGSPLTKKLVKHGAPADFGYHAVRHTVASFFEEASDFEVGLVLNHSSTRGKSSVTAGYRHSYAIDLKRKLLEQWADHVEGIVTGERLSTSTNTPPPGIADLVVVSPLSGVVDGRPEERDMTKQEFPKVQVRKVYESKGADAARKLATELGVENHRITRWIEREWPAKAKAPAKPAPAPKAKAAATKAAPAKAEPKKAAPRKRTPKPAGAAPAAA